MGNDTQKRSKEVIKIDITMNNRWAAMHRVSIARHKLEMSRDEQEIAKLDRELNKLQKELDDAEKQKATVSKN